MDGPGDDHPEWSQTERDKYCIAYGESESVSPSVMSDSLQPHEL